MVEIHSLGWDVCARARVGGGAEGKMKTKDVGLGGRASEGEVYWVANLYSLVR